MDALPALVMIGADFLSRAPMNSAVPIDRERERRAFRLFMLLAFVLLGAGIGLRDPWPSDEPRFTLVAKQMVESGDWLFPHRGRELYSEKPPVMMWSEAAAYEVTRSWRLAFLPPSLLGGPADARTHLRSRTKILEPHGRVVRARSRCCSFSSSGSGQARAD